MNGRLDRKTFMTTLGAAGLGLGLTAAGGARSAQAQEDARSADGGWRHDRGMLDERWQLHEEFYKGFTEALAKELGGANADEVDAAIRKAMMAVIDLHKDDGILTYGQAEALKVLVATTDVPLGPGPLGLAMFGLHGGWGQGMAMGGMAPCAGAMQPGYGSMTGDDMHPGMEGMQPGGMSRGMEGMPAGGMRPGEADMEMPGMDTGEEESPSSRQRHRKSRHERER